MERMKTKVTLLFLSFSVAAAIAVEPPVVIPTKYEQDRFYVITPAFNGVSATLLLDSGGATGIYPEFTWYWKTADSKVEENRLVFKGPSPFTKLPEDTIQENSIRLLPNGDEEVAMIRGLLKDGIIGNGWLGTRKWNFNYPERKLTSLKSIDAPRGNKVSLHFKNERLFYPRMEIAVDGESLDVLFDTGATSFFTEEAMRALSLKDAFAASSFVRESVFNNWRKKHPDWKIVEGGDRLGNHPLIRVPAVKIASHEIGPVWFARRPNKAYDESMAEYMDCKCAGAIGGNILKNFDVTIDYPGKAAWFYKK